MFPLISIHASAQKSAEAAFCAGYQEKFWEMEEKLFATQEEWSSLEDAVPTFKQFAADLGLDTKAFNQCLDDGEATNDVNADSMSAQTFGVDSTPTFFVNDIQIPLTSPDSMFQVIDYVGATGALPEIMPQTEDFHVQGSLESAQAAMAAFLDYASPDAAKYMTEVYPQIAEQYLAQATSSTSSIPGQAKRAAPAIRRRSRRNAPESRPSSWRCRISSSRTRRPGPRPRLRATALQATPRRSSWIPRSSRPAWTATGPAARPGRRHRGLDVRASAAQSYLFGDGNSLNGAPTFEEFRRSSTG